MKKVGWLAIVVAVGAAIAGVVLNSGVFYTASIAVSVIALVAFDKVAQR